jgi:hypothetical protein
MWDTSNMTLFSKGMASPGKFAVGLNMLSGLLILVLVGIYTFHRCRPITYFLSIVLGVTILMTVTFWNMHGSLPIDFLFELLVFNSITSLILAMVFYVMLNFFSRKERAYEKKKSTMH